MKKIKSLILLVLKGLLFFSLPILIFLFTLYEVVFDVSKDFSWLRTSLYAILWGVILIIPYGRKTVEEPMDRLEGLESRIRDGNWKAMEKVEKGYILQPKFNFPYNILGRESVHVEYSHGIAWIEGSTYYVDILLNEIKGKKNIWGTRGVKALSIMLVLTIIALPILVEAGVIERLKVEYHNFQAGHVEKLEITDENAMGNTVNNTNNYGFGAAYDDHIFYVEDGFNLVRITKDFQDKTYLIEKSSGWGISRLNIVEGWIFYHSGKKLSRMRTDGTKNEVLYGMGFLSDIHVRGNWIYFLNSSDEFAVYRMDVNGENLEKIIDREVSDLSIHDNRLFYSYGSDGEGYLESVNLEGQDMKSEMARQVNDLVRWEGYDYYIGHEDYSLYRVKTGTTGTPQILVDERVSGYIVTTSGIYYSLHSADAGYPGAGLYKVALDGTGNILIADARNVQSLSHVGNWILFESWDDTNNLVFERLDIQTDEITVLE